MRKEIEKIIENSEQAIMIVGDYNGDVGFKGEQKLDENGRMMIDWMEKYRLIMLKDDQRCQGEYTYMGKR